MFSKKICYALMGATLAIGFTVSTPFANAEVLQTNRVQPMQNQTSIQSVLNNPSNYMSKKITLTGKVERIVDASSFVMSSNDDPSSRILVVTDTQAMDSSNTKQKSGIAGVAVKDSQKVQVTGRINMLTITSETDSVNPKKDSAMVSQFTTNTPIVIVQPDSIRQLS